MKGLSRLTKGAAWLVATLIGLAPWSVWGAEPSAAEGYRLLLEEPYVPASFDDPTLEQVWKVWPEPLRSRAAAATPEERRQMAFERYGWTPRPGDRSGKPLQYVVDDAGNWASNCFTCHGGEVAGQVIPGLPNTRYALQTLSEDMREARRQLGQPPRAADIGSFLIPLGGSVGTTNAVVFGLALAGRRDEELNLKRGPLFRQYLHPDMDAPPWWHFRKKKYLYCDAFTPKAPRALMQFALDPVNGPERFKREWEDDFRHIYAYLESLEPPRYPFAVDRERAARGHLVFQDHCARCHGSYGERPSYPHRVVPIEEIGTDRVRFDAIRRSDREAFQRNWLSRDTQVPVILDPQGYLAPPLDGIWATAPYLHNGSVPTLWHLLRPDERPGVWKRTGAGYDAARVGLAVETLAEVPPAVAEPSERRHYFDTRRYSKSAAGHDYPAALEEGEKQDLLEYLKTL